MKDTVSAIMIAIACVLVLVGAGIVLDHKHITIGSPEPSPLQSFRDVDAGVTCWSLASSGISCLRDERWSPEQFYFKGPSKK